LLAFCPEQEDCKWWGKFPDFEKNQRNEKPHPSILFSAQNKKKKRCNLMIRFRDYQFLEVLLRSSSRQKCRKLLAFCSEQEDCKWWGKFPDFEKNQRNEKPHPNSPEQEKEEVQSDDQVPGLSISGSFTPILEPTKMPEIASILPRAGGLQMVG
jgi:hypothetical protein